MLDVAALTGTQVEVRLLESVTGCPPSALDELLESGLLVGDGAWLRFRHEIARLAVAQAVAGHRSQAVHEVVLATLRSFGCDDDARLAFHAEAAGDSAAVLRYAPAAARRAARLASHREAAAQYERALRFAAGADPYTLAGLHEGLADEVVLLDRWDDAETEGERALALWREVGDRLREGDALRRLSRIRWNLCRGGEAVVAAEAAVSVLEPLGPSVELARAYATYANQRMLYADHDVAIDLALRAQALAIQFGATAVHSDALNTQAASRSVQGLDWAGQMRQALDIALAGGHHIEAGRAYANLVAIYGGKREFAEAERYLEAGIAFCVEHDVTTYATCMRGEQGNIMERTSRWDEAVALSTQLLFDVGPSPANRLCSLIRLGVIGARRGEPQAWRYLDEAAAIADEAAEPQNQVPARLARAEAHWLEGDLDAARREAELAHDAAGLTPSGWLRGAAAAWLRRLGSPRPLEGEVAEPYRLLLEDDPVGAAAVWMRLGCPYDAAMALADASGETALGETALRETALREALGIVIGLGAQPAARIIRQRLRTLGARSIPAGPHTATRAAAVRADPARMRGPRPDLRRAHQRRDRREAVHLRQDRRPSRVGDPRQARRAEPGRREERRPVPAGGLRPVAGTGRSRTTTSGDEHVRERARQGTSTSRNEHVRGPARQANWRRSRPATPCRAPRDLPGSRAAARRSPCPAARPPTGTSGGCSALARGR